MTPQEKIKRVLEVMNNYEERYGHVDNMYYEEIGDFAHDYWDMIKQALRALEALCETSEQELKPCPIDMIEIYCGKDKEWNGWYNVLVNDETRMPICGPLSPELSKQLLIMVEAWSTRTSKAHKIAKEFMEDD